MNTYLVLEMNGASPSQVKSLHKLINNNRQPYGSLSNVLRRPAVVEGT